MRKVLTEKILSDLIHGQIKKDYVVTDITGMSVAIRKRKETTAVHFQCKMMKQGKRYIYPLGQYPALSLTKARAEYLRCIECINKGEEPIQKEVINNVDNTPTIGNMWQRFIAVKFTSFSENTKAKYLSLWNAHLQFYKDMQCSEITPQKTMELLKPYLNNHEYETAYKIASAFRALIDYAVFLELLSNNPIVRITSYLPKVKRQHLATFNDDTMKEDMIQLFFDMSDCQQVIQMQFYCYFFTLLRNEELRSLRVDEVFNDYIVVKTKTLEKFKQPLTTQAKKIIDYCIAHKKDRYSPYVFEGTSELGMLGENTLNHALNTRGYKGKLRIHGIRSLGRQWLQNLPDTKESLIEMCLSHVGGNTVQQAYNRGEYIEERRRILQKWSDFVCECAGEYFNRLFEM